MRRLIVTALCGALTLAACNDEARESPTEPMVRAPEAEAVNCRVTRFPLVRVSALILKVFPSGKLRIEALARGAAIAILWDTCRKLPAQKAAIDFVSFMNRNSGVLRGTQADRNALINLVLNGVGITTQVPTDSPGDFGVGLFDPNNPNNTLVKTQNSQALVELKPGSFTEPTVIVIRRNPDAFKLTNFNGNQFPPFYDYDAINPSGQHIIQNGNTAIVAFCLLSLEEFGIPGQYPPGGYPINLRIGHNPVAGAPGFPFELLPPVDLVAAGLADDLNCPTTTASLGSGASDFASAPWQTLGRYLSSALLPKALWAAVVGKLPPRPPIGGSAPSLSPFGVVEPDVFSDGFEAAAPPWTTTGFWNRSTLKNEGNTPIENEAYPTYVDLAEGDNSGGALPDPNSGDWAMWYGEPADGNFIGIQDGEGDGGNSTEPNSGDATSPPFAVPVTPSSVTLRFFTWFEIESVDAHNFDRMSVVVDENGNAAGGQTVLGFLNPAEDPNGDERTPFTTADFGPPVWEAASFDLSGFKGKTVQVIFRFETMDAQYNGFRGWIVDDVRVETGPVGPSLRLAPPGRANLEVHPKRSQ
jgi:hypothetical protein